MNKKLKNSFILILGVCIFRKADEFKNISVVLIIIGAGLFVMSLSSSLLINLKEGNPEVLKQSKIDLNDERNTMIRNKAKATSSDITQWVLMGIAYITIIVNSPLWATLTVAGVFMFKDILELYYMSKYQKTL